jgi:hypothetical protein
LARWLFPIGLLVFFQFRLIPKRGKALFSSRKNLEKQWDRGADVSTEELRVALQRYRSFFDRLLKIEQPPNAGYETSI